MSSVKEKTFKKLRRKKIWPSILVFILFVIVCVVAITVFLQMFALYIMGTKVVHHFEEAQRVGKVIDALIDGGDTLHEAAYEMHKSILEDKEIYITDRDGNVVYHVGDSIPDFGKVLEFNIGTKFVAVADSGGCLAQTDRIGMIFCMPMEDVFRKVFVPGEKGENIGQWLGKTIVSQDYWLRTILEDREHAVYVKCNMQFKREDIVYVCIFGLIAFVLLLIPVILLLINTIVSIVTQRKMTRLFYLDPVTGGRNWLCFQNYAERILTKLMNNKKAFAVVNLHFERYQNYCACYGMKAGEGLLEAMDGFLNARIRKNEIFARHEGADFGLLLMCEGTSEEERQKNCCKRMHSLLAELAGLKPEQKIHFHAGVHMIPPYISEENKWYQVRKGVNIDQLFAYANAARLQSNCAQGHRISFFDQEMLGKQMWERWVEDSMEAALRNEEFKVYLQPKYSPVNHKLVGAEALVRWVSPEEGVIVPRRFIPIFESTGFITRLDDYMISHVAKLLAEWTIQGKKTVPVSINVSRAHFSQEGVAERICQLVDAYGPQHELIELEVTEGAFFDDKDILVETVKQLRSYGFGVSMDDFGAGYSSLNSLKDIPLDVLKLDGDFFRGDDDGRGQIIIKEAIRLARSLDMRVVAEGIEKKEQVEFLAGQGCDMIQGFYFSEPMPVTEFEEKVEKDA